MKVLMLSNDVKILEEGSAVRARMAWYGSIVDELHIVIPTDDRRPTTSDKKIRIAENVFAYPASASNKISALFNARRIGIRIITTTYLPAKIFAEQKLRRAGLPASPAGGQPTTWLITSQDPFALGFTGWLISKRTKTKFELQIHTDFLSPWFARESFLNKMRVKIAGFILPRADGIRVVSRRIKDSLQPIYPPKFLRNKNLGGQAYNLQPTPTVLPIFVDIQKIRDQAAATDLRKKYPQFDFLILMASRLTREKNIGLAIETMREVVKEYPKTGLIIVGSGTEEKNLKLKTIRLKLDNNVIFEPWVRDIVSYYKTTDVFLLTSNYEGFGLSLVEAAASGVPIVSTDVGLVGDVLRDGEEALVCPIGDRKCLTDRLERMIKFPNLSREFSLRAQSALEAVASISKEEYLIRLRESWQSLLK